MRGCRPAGPLTALLLRHPLCPDRAWFSWGWESTAKGGAEGPQAWKESTLLSGPFLAGSALGTGSHTQSFPVGKEPPHLLISPKKLCGFQLKAQEKGSQGSRRVLAALTRVQGETATERHSLRGGALADTRGVCSRSMFHPAAFLGQKVFLVRTKNSHTPKSAPAATATFARRHAQRPGPSEVPQKQRAQQGAVGKRGPRRLQGIPGLVTAGARHCRAIEATRQGHSLQTPVSGGKRRHVNALV